MCVMSPAPDHLDRALWVETNAVPGRCYLVFNPHTFTGLFGVWSEERDEYLSLSKSELTDASSGAQYWIAGYLAGAEPDPDEMFGAAMHDAIDDDPRWQRWRDA